MNKTELRRSYKEKRLQLTPGEKSRLDDLLLIQLQRLALPAYVQTLLTFWPMEQYGEMNTHLYTAYLEHLIPGLLTAYPVTDMSTATMLAVATDDDTEFKKNALGLLEPESGDEVDPLKIDLVFVPLLAVDSKGYRVGYGKGFYDRYLKRCRQDAITVGFSYFEPVEKIEDADQFDVPLKYCVTPYTIHEF